MAITLTGNPTATRESTTMSILSAHNPLLFEFTAGAGETSLQVQVTNTVGTEIGTFKTLPFASDNTLTIDVSSIVKSQLSNDDNSENTRTATGFDGGSAFGFKLKYRVGGTGSYTSIGNTYYGANAVRQIGSTYDATLAEYTAILSGSPKGVDFTGKFLTLFDNPVLFWYADVLDPSANSEVSVWQSQLAFPLALADYTDVDTIRAQWYRQGSLISTTASVDAGTTTPIITFAIPTAERCYSYTDVVIDVGIGNGGGGMGTPSIDAITFEIRRACNNPTAIKWLNSLGAWECWVFEGRTPRTIDTAGSGEYGIFPATLSTATETRRYFSKDRRQSLSVSADNLTTNQVIAISEIATSPNVVLFVGALTAGTSFEDWHGVTVDAGSFDFYDDYNQKHKIAFTVNLPDEFTISN